MQNKISSKEKGLLVERCCKGTVYADQSSFFVAKLWNQLNVNTSEEWIGRWLREEKRNLHESTMPPNSGLPIIPQSKQSMENLKETS